EQARGDVTLMGPASDIYSLGVILYEMLAGRVPFEGDAMAILSQGLVDEPTPPSRYRAESGAKLQAICLKASAKKPDARGSTMADFAAALTEYLKAANPSALAGPGPTQAAGTPFADEIGKTEVRAQSAAASGAEGPKSAPWGVIGAVGAILVALGGGIYYMV